MPDLMHTSTVHHALQRLGESLSYHRDVELLLVGGAAGMLTGVLAPSRTTTDCDVMVYLPPEAMVAIETAAEFVAAELGLASTWLDSNVQIRLDALPDDLMKRRMLVGHWGLLRVWAIGRADLIAMKLLAGRAQDLEDLLSIRPRSDDVAFVRSFLSGLESKGTSAEQIAGAVDLLNSLKVFDDV